MLGSDQLGRRARLHQLPVLDDVAPVGDLQPLHHRPLDDQHRDVVEVRTIAQRSYLLSRPDVEQRGEHERGGRLPTDRVAQRTEELRNG
jgi:hypothetical protein